MCLIWVVHNINNSNGRSSVPLCGTAYLTTRQLLRMYNIEYYDEVQIICRDVWYNMAVTYFEAKFWNCLKRMSKSRETWIQKIEEPNYMYIQIRRLPDIRKIQQPCHKIRSNFSKNCNFSMSPVTVDRKGANILLPLPTLVTQVVINSTNVCNFHVQCRLTYQE